MLLWCEIHPLLCERELYQQTQYDGIGCPVLHSLYVELCGKEWSGRLRFSTSQMSKMFGDINVASTLHFMLRQCLTCSSTDMQGYWYKARAQQTYRKPDTRQGSVASEDLCCTYAFIMSVLVFWPGVQGGPRPRPLLTCKWLQILQPFVSRIRELI